MTHRELSQKTAVPGTHAMKCAIVELFTRALGFWKLGTPRVYACLTWDRVVIGRPQYRIPCLEGSKTGKGWQC
jgi:hypothetical protein